MVQDKKTEPTTVHLKKTSTEKKNERVLMLISFWKCILPDWLDSVLITSQTWNKHADQKSQSEIRTPNQWH